MLVYKALHILFMFGAVTLLVGEAVFYGRAIWRRDVAGLAAIRRLMGGRPILGVGFLLAGIVFGVLAALAGAFDLLAGWLVAAYLLVVVLFVVNATPWAQRLPRLGLEAIEVEEGVRDAQAVVSEMARMRTPTVAVVSLNIALFAAIIADMVLKPF